MILKPLPPWQHPLVTFNGVAVKEFEDWLQGVDALLRPKPVKFAALPASPIEGTLIPVTDSTVNTWGSIIGGGGVNHVLAYFNGTAWTVAAK